MPTRLVDLPYIKAVTGRKKPVRVLVLGLTRTGTSSLCAALRKLGYSTFQMRDLLADPDALPLWREAIELTLLPTAEKPMRKKNRTIFPPYGERELDTLLGNYDAIADFPASLFYKELVEAYPDAKIIVTTRSYEEWEKSMQNSIWLLFKWKVFVIARRLGVTQMASLSRLMHLVLQAHNGNHYGGPKAREAYEKYYADVRALVPAEKKLEIECGKGEWKPLLEFLEVDKEKREALGNYPVMDENASMEKGLTDAWWSIINWFLLMVGVVFVSILGLVAIRYQSELWARFEGTLKMLEPWVGFVVGNGTANATTGKSEL